MKKQLTLVLLIFFASITCYAQKTTSYGLPSVKEYDRWSVGATVGISHLLSDMLSGDKGKNRVINQGNFLPAFGLQVHHQVTHSIGIRAEGSLLLLKDLIKIILINMINLSLLRIHQILS